MIRDKYLLSEFKMQIYVSLRVILYMEKQNKMYLNDY